MHKAEERSPKKGYGYSPKESMYHTTGFLTSNDYGYIPGLRGPQYAHEQVATLAAVSPRLAGDPKRNMRNQA